MRLYTNEKLVERQTKIARYTMWGGMAVLIGAIIALYSLENEALAYLAVFAGFILTYISSNLATRWIKEPRADHALGKALKGFDNKYLLYNFLKPIPHILITPTGVLAFKIKSHDGAVICANGKWNRPWKVSRLIGGMGQEPLGDPIAELNADIAKVKKFLADQIPAAATVPVDGYVVFTDPKVELSVDDSSLPVVLTDNLKDTLRKRKAGAILSPQTQDALTKIFRVTDGKTTEQ